MPTDTTSVPTAYLRTLLQNAAEQGCDSDQLLKELQIDPQELEDNLYFSAIKYGQLYQRVMRQLQDEMFGMVSDGKVRLGTFRLMCLTVLHCSNLRQAIIRAGEFSEIARGFVAKGYLWEENAVARITMEGLSSITEVQFKQMLSTTSPNKIRTTMAVWHRFNCWLIGQEIPLDNLLFTFSRPNEFEALAESSPARQKFDQPCNGLEFPAKYLDYPVVQNQETLMDFLRSGPYHLVIKDSAQQSLKVKVRAILSKDVSSNMPGAEEVASQLNLSVTTLRRRLQSEGTSYQKLKDQCRMEAAFHYLSCRDLSNTCVAERLGFDESSAFFRAFKKWTGITPGEYRKQLLS